MEIVKHRRSKTPQELHDEKVLAYWLLWHHVHVMQNQTRRALTLLAAWRMRQKRIGRD